MYSTNQQLIHVHISAPYLKDDDFLTLVLACTLYNLLPFTLVTAPTNWSKGKLLGSGAFGQVFLCHDNDTGNLVDLTVSNPINVHMHTLYM